MKTPQGAITPDLPPSKRPGQRTPPRHRVGERHVQTLDELGPSTKALRRHRLSTGTAKQHSNSAPSPVPEWVGSGFPHYVLPEERPLMLTGCPTELAAWRSAMTVHRRLPIGNGDHMGYYTEEMRRANGEIAKGGLTKMDHRKDLTAAYDILRQAWTLLKLGMSKAAATAPPLPPPAVNNVDSVLQE